MLPGKLQPDTIEAYIDAAAPEVREKLNQLLHCVRAAAPGATEGLKWRMPAFSYDRILVSFAVFKKHIGFYPTAAVIKAFAKDLSSFKTAAGSVQFPLDKPLPLALIRKMVLLRVQESREEDAKWRT